MYIRKALFRSFDKVLLLAAVAFAVGAASRIGPPREAEQLKGQAAALIDRLDLKMETDKAPQIPTLDHCKRLEEKFAEVKDMPPLDHTIWHPPRSHVRLVHVMNTLSATTELDHPIVGTPFVRDRGRTGPGRNVEVSVSGNKRVLTTTGKGEGWATVSFHDSTGQRHLVVVEVMPFVPDPEVHPPENVRVALVPGTKKVKLEWDAPKLLDDRAPVQAYRVYRKKEGTQKLDQLQRISAGAKKGREVAGGSYEDSDTAFDSRYTYQVTSVSTTARPAESRPSAPARVLIGRDTEFFVKSASPKAASIKVYKWQSGRWMGKTFIGKPGDEIGEKSEVCLADGRPQRSTVDFRTGCYLVDIDTESPFRRASFGRCLETRGQRIVYQDRDGSLKEKWGFECDAAPADRFGKAASDSTVPVGTPAHRPRTVAPAEAQPQNPEVIE